VGGLAFCFEKTRQHLLPFGDLPFRHFSTEYNKKYLSNKTLYWNDFSRQAKAQVKLV
jgi:hypothetical protein